MANEKKSNALAQYGPVAAPLLGVVLAIVFIAAAVVTNKVGENQTSLQKMIGKVRSQLDSDKITPDAKQIPLADSVSQSLKPADSDNWKPSAAATKLLQLPITWQVTMDAPEQDTFARYDTDHDGYWSPDEFSLTDYPPQHNLRADFDNWDRNPKDGKISRAEFNDPPEDNAEKFRKLDKNDDKVLTVADGEVSQKDADAWDDYPYDGKIDFNEYDHRYDKKTWRDFGPVRNVQAKADTEKMEILVTWENPDVAELPEDIAFIIERRAPEKMEERMAEYRRKVIDYTTAHRQWQNGFETWWKAPNADDASKTNKQVYPDEGEAKKKFAETTSEPVQPEKPSEWEPVTPKDQPVTGNEFHDTNFDTEVTYTYAVRMATKAHPRKGVDVKKEGEWFEYPADKRTKAAGHPVIVHNRIVMEAGGIAGNTATINLTKWISIPDASNGKPHWYRIRVSERVSPNDTLGGNYSVDDLKQRNVSMMDGAQVVNAEELLPKNADFKVNFTTNYSFVTNNSRGYLLTSLDLGDFELPIATRGPVTDPTVPPSAENPLEIRCLSVTRDGKEGVFQITRWHQVGDVWLRVVQTVHANKGQSIGKAVTLGSLGDDTVVLNDSGEPLTSAQLAKYKDEKVDLSAGNYDGLNGRSLVFGSNKIDLYGTLYK